jgi:hypothetical protein
LKWERGKRDMNPVDENANGKFHGYKLCHSGARVGMEGEGANRSRDLHTEFYSER